MVKGLLVNGKADIKQQISNALQLLSPPILHIYFDKWLQYKILETFANRATWRWNSKVGMVSCFIRLHATGYSHHNNYFACSYKCRCCRRIFILKMAKMVNISFKQGDSFSNCCPQSNCCHQVKQLIIAVIIRTSPSLLSSDVPLFLQ